MKISVVTIVYNNKECIEDCIKSVLSQSYNDVEFIVVDGNSTDGTKDIIEKYKNSISIFLSENDNGLYDALNKGIKLCSGDVIGILHSDDLYYDKDTLLKVASVFKSSETDLVYAKGMYVGRNDISEIKRIYTSCQFRKSYLYLGWIPLHTTIYVKRDVFNHYGFYDEKYKIASDYEISLRWFTNPNIKTYFLDTWVVKMRLGGKSTTPGLQKKKSAEDYAIIKKYKLWGFFTLGFKIARKIPQYIIPRIIKFR